MGLSMVSGHAAARQPGPMDTLSKNLDAVMAVLEDARFKDVADKNLQRQKIITAAESVFDFVEITKRALARNWKLFTPHEREVFAGLFAVLLKEVYGSKIQSSYNGQRVVLIGQEMVTARRALVKTKLVSRNGDLPVVYSMRWHNRAWKVYDVRIQGVSLVQNYRSQFNSYLLNRKPVDLIAQLRKKVVQYGGGR